MNDNEKIQLIEKRLSENDYFAHPSNQSHTNEDITFLISFVKRLLKKNEILSNQLAELTQEMENVKSDFGNQR